MNSIIKNRSVIKISGQDSEKFLQNIITNDISQKEPIYAMILSPQGRFLFDVFIFRDSVGFLLDIFSGTKDIMLKRLNMYKINLDVKIEDIPDLEVSYGDNIGELSYKDPRYVELMYRNFVPAGSSKETGLYLSDKYKHTIPDGGVDLLYDKAMPQEYGAEELHAISYTKGCYVGQEVVSRTKSQGVVRKRIYKLKGTGLDSVEHGSEILLGEDKVGIFCSGYNDFGIALIREENILQSSAKNFTLLGSDVSLKKACWYN